MRILHLTWGLGIGGLESMLTDITSAQAKEHEVWVLIANQDVSGSLLEAFGARVRVIKLGRPVGSRNPLHLLRLAWHARRIRPQVIHAHHESFARLRRPLRVPMVLTIHNTREPLIPAIRAFDSLVCISSAVREDVLARRPESRPGIIRNGVQFAAVRRKHAYGGGGFRIVQVGRLAHAQKGQDVLIRALGLLRSRHVGIPPSVDFIGEGDSLEWLRALAGECGVADLCHFRGSFGRNRLYARLADYDLLVQPSRYEGFGLTVIEGLAAGLPVLVSNIEGPREIIEESALGWTFRSEDPASLADALLKLEALSQQPGFGEQMQRRVRQAQERFDVARTASEYVREYRRVLAGLRAPAVADCATSDWVQ